MGAAGTRKKTPDELAYLRKRIEHCLRVNSEDGVCTLAIGALTQRFGGVHETIHQVAGEIGIEIRRQGSCMSISPPPAADVDGKTSVDRMKRRITACMDAHAAQKRATPPGPVCMGLIPDGGARETLRMRMEPHPWMEGA